MFKKTDRIAFKSDTRIIHGTIVKVNQTTYLTIADGGEYSYKVPHHLATASLVPPLAIPEDCMKSWEIRNFKENKNQSEETMAYTADIYYRGEKVLHASNSGRGEGDRIVGLGTHKYVDFFQEEVKMWAYEVYGNVSGYCEVDHEWIMWKVRYEGFGISQKEFCEKNLTREEKPLGNIDRKALGSAVGNLLTNHAMGG